MIILQFVIDRSVLLMSIVEGVSYSLMLVMFALDWIEVIAWLVMRIMGDNSVVGII